jgi:hypothetical protein
VRVSEEPEQRHVTVEDALDLLRHGALDVEGRLVDASNATLFCVVERDGVGAGCVYKPIRGERPLWDFPDGTLAHREVAAFAVSAASGWDVVPPTVLRDGPYGPGMVQLWIDTDDEVDVAELLRGGDARLRRMALLDAVLNNADRKGGHLLPTEGGHIYGVDHGVCFAVEPKLRTVLWQWRAQRITEQECDELSALRARLAGDLGTELGELLAPDEVTATERRLDALLTARTFPEPDPDWPAIPWPPW